VLRCGEAGVLLRPGGADDQPRQFMDLLFVYCRARRIADKEFLARLLGANSPS